jgi:tetratricopeptide (TPR) repeat protein
MKGAPALLSAWLGAMLLAAGLLTTAAAPAAEPFEEGRRAFASGDWAGALAAFETAWAAGREEPAVLYNIGVCRYRLGEYAAADRAFAELAARWPAMAQLARYNAGLARYRLRDTAGAAAAFESAAQGPDPKVAALAARMIERMEAARAAAPVPAWSAFVDLGLGFDDNVALLDDASLAGGESTDSPFAAVFGQIGRAPGAGGPGATASAYLVRYPDAPSFDQDVLQLAGFRRLTWGPWQAEVGPQVSFSTLDGGSFERRLGARVSLERALTAATVLEARLVVEAIEELDERVALVDGSRGLLELEVEHRLAGGRLGFEYAFSVDDRAAASVSPTRHAFGLRYRRVLDDRWSVLAAGVYRASRYDDLEEPREEDRSELALVLLRELSGGWQLALDYRYTSNAANIEAFDYARNRLELGINRVFP